MSNEFGLIYREAWYGNRPKSVALRRESDYHTGLSFKTEPPSERSYLVYSVSDLEKAGYTIEFNAGQAIVSKWDSRWALRDNQGEIRNYAPYHVSIYRDQVFWKRWYDAELNTDGEGTSQYSRDFFLMALAYHEG